VTQRNTVINLYSYVNGESGTDNILTTNSRNFDKDNTPRSVTYFVTKTYKI